MAVAFRAATSAGFTGEATPATLTIEKPTGTVAGDILLAHVGYTRTSGSGVPTCTPPDGWKSVRKTQGPGATTRQGETFVKVAGGSEPSSYDFILKATSGNLGASGGIAVFSGGDTKDPINAEGGVGITFTTAYVCPSVTTTVDDCLVVALVNVSNQSNQSFTPPEGMDERWDADSGGSVASACATDKAPVEVGETGTRTLTSSSANNGVAHTVALAPAPPPPPTVVTQAATGVTHDTATLNGTVNPQGTATTAWFEYGETEALELGKVGEASAGSGEAPAAKSHKLEGLKPDTKYFFRVAASNAHGEDEGTILSFTTEAEPPPEGASRRVAVNREYPPARHVVIVRDPKSGAPISRWAEDEHRARNVFDGLTTSGALNGGDKQLNLNLSRESRAQYPDMEGMLDVEVQLQGREVIWEGRHGKDQRSDGERSVVGLEAVGHGAAMEDRKGIKAGIIDCDLSKWGEPSTQRRLNELGAGRIFSGSTQVGVQGDQGELPGLLFDFTDVEDAAERSEKAEQWYYSGGPDIGQLRYFFKNFGPAGGGASWIDQARICANSVDTGAGTDGGNHAGNSNTNPQVVVAGTNGLRYIRIHSRYTATFSGRLDQVHAWLRPTILSRLATEQIGPPQGTWPDIGYTAAQMLRALVPEFSYLELGQLDDDGFIIPQAWWGEGGTTLAQIVAEITRYGLYDYRVRGKRFELREPGTYGERWVAPRGPSQLEEAGEDTERRWDRIVISFQDPSGRTGSVGYPGSGADLEFPELQITDPDHPAVKTERPREESLDLQVITTHTRAKEVGERWLKEVNELSRSGKAVLEGYVQSERGVWHPVAKVREGDLIRFPDSRDRGWRKVIDYSYDAVKRQKTVSLDAPSEGLAALLERFRAVLVPMGIG